jgi:hypothetical protein
MAQYTTTPLIATPDFDMELLMNTCQETRINSSTMDKLSDTWERWLPLTKAKHIEDGSGSYLLAWLEKSVEDEVDDKWRQTPSEAFVFNALAQVMCMGVVHSLIPQIEEIGCAPAPHPTDALADALEAEDVPYLTAGEPGLSRRYAVVTHYPFKGGCEICTLREQCPRNGGGMSVTLPGYA